jgi:hypothetical protein
VRAFGSYVSGLGTRDSDLDVVLTGVCEPSDPSLGFYAQYERPVVASLLDMCVALGRQTGGVEVVDLLACFPSATWREPLALCFCVSVLTLRRSGWVRCFNH